MMSSCWESNKNISTLSYMCLLQTYCSYPVIRFDFLNLVYFPHWFIQRETQMSQNASLQSPLQHFFSVYQSDVSEGGRKEYNHRKKVLKKLSWPNTTFYIVLVKVRPQLNLQVAANHDYICSTTFQVCKAHLAGDGWVGGLGQLSTPIKLDWIEVESGFHHKKQKKTYKIRVHKASPLFWLVQI